METALLLAFMVAIFYGFIALAVVAIVYGQTELAAKVIGFARDFLDKFR